MLAHKASQKNQDAIYVMNLKEIRKTWKDFNLTKRYLIQPGDKLFNNLISEVAKLRPADPDDDPLSEIKLS